MRLSFIVATVLLAEQCTHTFGFSTVSPRQRRQHHHQQRTTTTSLALLTRPEAASTETAADAIAKPANPADILAKYKAAKVSTTQTSTDEDNDNDNGNDDAIIPNLLSIIEKRMKDGPGSLSATEAEQFKIASDRILADRVALQSKKDDEDSDNDERTGWGETGSVETVVTSTTSSVDVPVPETPVAVPEAPAAVAVPVKPSTQESADDSLLSLISSLVVSEDEEDDEPDPVEALLPKLEALVRSEEDISVEEDPVPASPVDSLLPKLKNLVVSEEEIAVEAPVETTSSPVAVDNKDLPDYSLLHEAAIKMDSKKVSELIKAGLKMDEATTNAAFWAVVRSVDQAEAQDQPLSGDMPRMLHHIYDADLDHLLNREQIRTNVTCMQPKDEGVGGKARAMNYIFDDSSHKDLPLSEGRRCEDGTCCDACSRNIFPTFATENEIDFNAFPDINSLSFNELERVSAATILQFVRLIERVRRTITHEYGLELSSILPLQAYSRKYVAGTTQQGGGGGEGDHVTLHTDEATHDGYHYSCVIYLSSSGEDFQGGAFVFNDPAANEEEAAKTAAESEGLEIEDQIRRAGRTLTPINPMRGNAVIFSSGWENMHEVETITSGTRYAVPCFFTTCPVPEQAYEQMAVGKPKTDEDIADDWLHLLLAHRKELPQESTGRVKELFMKWHTMCSPLDQH